MQLIYNQFELYSHRDVIVQLKMSIHIDIDINLAIHVSANPKSIIVNSLKVRFRS